MSAGMVPSEVFKLSLNMLSNSVSSEHSPHSNGALNASACVYQQLYSISDQLVPYLSPVDIEASQGLHLEADNKALFSQLYHDLQQHHPEAGGKYWIYKCWQLAIWQPILLSVISVYGLNVALPLSALKLRYLPTSIAGYQLDSSDYLQGSTHQLIEQSASQSATLINCFYDQLKAVAKENDTPFKKLFCQRLLKDQLLAALAKVPHFLPQLSVDTFNQQVDLWQQHYQLKASELLLNNQGEPIRNSCCLEYQLATCEYCSNCPKTRKASLGTPKDCT